MPFCGDGDLAVEHYLGRPIFAADIEEMRVQEAQRTIPNAVVIRADCETWPFGESLCAENPVAVADFDSYSYPYASFRSFWQCAEKLDRLVLFFTDGERQTLMRNGHYREPRGERVFLGHIEEKRQAHNAYLFRIVWPWFDDLMQSEGWKVLDRFRYLRGWMSYWGAVVER